MNPVVGNCVFPAMDPQSKTSLILFRNDLRIHDNEALLEASKFSPWLATGALSPRHIHQPHLLSVAEQRNYEIGIGEDYPAPVIDLEASYEKLRS